MKQQLAELSERQELDRTSLMELQSDLLTMALDRGQSRGDAERGTNGVRR